MKEKTIYSHLNMLKENPSNEAILMGLVWSPRYFNFAEKMQAIVHEKGLSGITFEKGPDYIKGLEKPTLFRSNEFTFAFQEITNTYGIPAYKEANPALFSAISFPFLFGVMFGDIMHGVLLTIFASWLCWTKREPGTLAGSLGMGRYLFLLMGIFATYNGLIYNDMSSTSIELFGKTCYTVLEPSKEDPHMVFAKRPLKKVDPDGAECVYPFGMDPIWFRST